MTMILIWIRKPLLADPDQDPAKRCVYPTVSIPDSDPSPMLAGLLIFSKNDLFA